MSKVTEDHIAQYEAEGCVKVEGVFDQVWIDRLTAAIDEAYAAFGTPAFDALATGARSQNPPTVHPGEGQVQLRNFAQHVPAIRDWLWNSPAAETVAALMRASHVRFWMDATFIKDGASEASATPWHNDECTFPFVGEMAPSFWVALTDVPIENAPMITLAGSNRDPWRYYSPMSPQGLEVDGFRPWSHLVERVNAPDAPIRTWTCKAGDILLIHGKTIHASLPRRADYPGRRIALTTRWLGHDIRWKPNPLSMRIPALEATGVLSDGAEPPDCHFPVVWRAAA